MLIEYEKKGKKGKILRSYAFIFKGTIKYR